MRVLDLFSGIGGFSLGFEAAGMETTAFCEQDKFFQAILKKHWKDKPIFDDVRTLDGKQFRGQIELVCGGFPCQPFSNAGKRRGAEDDRHLWPEMFRIINETNARWVIGENVNGFLSMGFDQTVSDLEASGYEVQAFVIPAVAVGAAHRRDRIWIMANSKSKRIGRETGNILETDGGQDSEIPQQINGTSASVAANPNGAGLSFVYETGNRRPQSEGIDQGSELVRAYTANGQEQWKTEPRMGRVADGVPNRVDRLRALGNAIVPQIATQIGLAIMEAEQWADQSAGGLHD